LESRKLIERAKDIIMDKNKKIAELSKDIIEADKLLSLNKGN
jgi:AmiR/NasT family two-component response regulator